MNGETIFVVMSSLRKRVLVCPLNWGLGHATRCIPIIAELITQEAEVMIAGDGDSLDLLKSEFPSLKYHHLKSKPITYSANGNMALQMLKSAPRLLQHRKLPPCACRRWSFPESPGSV